MSRSFTSSSSQYLTTGSVTLSLSAYPITIAAWYFTNSASQSGTTELVRIDTTGGVPGTASYALQLNYQGGLSRGWSGSTGSSNQFWMGSNVSTGTWSLGVWVATSDNTGTIYQGVAGSVTSNSTIDFAGGGSITFAGLNCIKISQGGPSLYGDGYIAEVAVWNAGLTANEVQTLANSIPANRVRPQSLAYYYPLRGILSPEPDLSGNRLNLTLTNAPPAGTSHAPLTWRKRQVTPVSVSTTGTARKPLVFSNNWDIEQLQSNDTLAGQMPTGAITQWAGSVNNPPAGWVICNGQGLSTSANSALFAAIGYTYGGSGSTFNVPNFQGSFPIGSNGTYGLGSSGGASSVTLATANLPSHSHPVWYTGGVGNSGGIGNSINAVGIGSQTTTDNTGSGTAFSVLNPYVAVNYIIKT